MKRGRRVLRWRTGHVRVFSHLVNCTIETNHMAAVTGTSGDWVFTPDAGLLAMVDMVDTDYLPVRVLAENDRER